MTDRDAILALVERFQDPARKHISFQSRLEAAQALTDLLAERDEIGRALVLSGKVSRQLMEKTTELTARISELEAERTRAQTETARAFRNLVAVWRQDVLNDETFEDYQEAQLACANELDAAIAAAFPGIAQEQEKT